jgi:cytochrome c-type biogenesis protein
VVILGLQMTGMLRIPVLMRDTRVHHQHEHRTYWTSGLVGIAFAAGWSPCIGPILAGILAIASQQHNAEAALLLLVYSLGLAVPFFLTAVAIGAVLPVLNRIKRFLPAIEFCAGVFMIAVGLVLVNNAFYTVAGWFYQFVPTPNL